MRDEPTMTLRPATSADAAAITECVCAAYLPWIGTVGRQPGPMLADYAKVIATHEVHVAEREGSVVGVLVIDATDGRVFVDNVCVDPAVQGQGLGRLLLAFAEGQARRRGLKSIELSTHELMLSNLALYATLGYVVTERRVVDGYPRVFMSKALAS